MLVLGRHMGGVPLDVPFVAQSALVLWLRTGWIGVDLFFVLSGFLVSGLLFREYGRLGEVHAGRFLVRRGLRIYPAFYIFLISTSIATGTVGTRQFLADASFVQNYIPGLWDHTWTLAVEEHFYLLLALLVAVLVRRDAARSTRGTESRGGRDPFFVIVPIFAAVALTELVLRIATARYGKPYFAHHLYPTHLRLDSLLFGVLLEYLVWSRGQSVWAWVRAHQPLLVLTSIVCLAPPCFLPATDPFMETAGFTLLYIGFGAVLMLALRPAPEANAHATHDAKAQPRTVGSWRRVVDGCTPVPHRAASVLAWIGVYSYSIYLWHLAVKKWAVPAIVRTLGAHEGGIVALLVYLGASLLTGVAMARLIEIPTLALRDRWLPGVATLQVPPAERRDDLAA